jgi:hypothetical protein
VGDLRQIAIGLPLHEQADLATEAIIAGNGGPAVFRSGDRLVRLGGEAGDLRIETIPAAALKERLSRVARFTGAKGGPVHPPGDVVQALLNRPRQDARLPELDRVVTAPVFGSDGVLSVEPGYHPSARAWYQPGPQMAGLRSPWPREPDDLKAALYELELVLGDFPFDSEASRAHAVAEMLLPFVREMIPGPTPLHLHTAPREGTGKGLLATCMTWPSAGDDCLVSPAHNEEEWDKRIGAELARGRPAIVWDNVKGDLGSGSLELALTAGSYVSRVLGFSRMGSYPVRCLWVMTSNNARLSAGLARRSVMIRMDAGVERPEQRSGWSVDLPQWVKRRRRDLVAACHVIVADWLDEGMPHWMGEPLGSFEGWSAVMGGILENAGVGGFLGNRGEVLARTAEDDEMPGFFLAWESSGLGPMSARELAAAMEYGALADFAPQELVGARSLGHALGQYRDRVYAGLALRYEHSGNRRVWALERVDAPDT